MQSFVLVIVGMVLVGMELVLLFADQRIMMLTLLTGTASFICPDLLLEKQDLVLISCLVYMYIRGHTKLEHEHSYIPAHSYGAVGERIGPAYSQPDSNGAGFSPLSPDFHPCAEKMLLQSSF